MPDVRRLWKQETVTPWPFSMLEYQKIKKKTKKGCHDVLAWFGCTQFINSSPATPWSLKKTFFLQNKFIKKIK